MRVIFEALGADVDWDSASRTITASRSGAVVIAAIDDHTMIVDGIRTTMDAAPMIIEGRTLVPVRFVSEAFGCEVE
jgi:hypothetical protein